MKLKYTLAALAATTLASNAVITVVATTSFETSDNFASGNNQSTAYNITATDSSVWTSTVGTFGGTWAGQALTGAQSSVHGNTSTLTVNAAGSDGVTTVDFSWERFTASTGNIVVESSTDGGATFANTQNFAIAGAAGGGWAAETATFNQTGDVIVRFTIAGTGGVSFDDITVSADVVPEPSSTALLGLGGLALILRRRK